jgi:hypothetical protein
MTCWPASYLTEFLPVDRHIGPKHILKGPFENLFDEWRENSFATVLTDMPSMNL